MERLRSEAGPELLEHSAARLVVERTREGWVGEHHRVLFFLSGVILTERVAVHDVGVFDAVVFSSRRRPGAREHGFGDFPVLGKG